jgi:hypothetical protein
MRELAAFSVLGLFLLACGGSEPPPESPPPAEPVRPTVEVTPPPAKAEPAAEAPKEEPKPAEKPAAPEPQFTEGMSVADAVKAVPVGVERANMDQETLSEPIKEFSVYEPCKPGAAHIKLKIAVWDGKAVGIDVTSTPKNDKLVACVKEQIKKITWKAHVKSLNTVEYSF